MCVFTTLPVILIHITVGEPPIKWEECLALGAKKILSVFKNGPIIITR